MSNEEKQIVITPDNLHLCIFEGVKIVKNPHVTNNDEPEPREADIELTIDFTGDTVARLCEWSAQSLVIKDVNGYLRPNIGYTQKHAKRTILTKDKFKGAKPKKSKVDKFLELREEARLELEAKGHSKKEIDEILSFTEQ